jgi:hypothetical protein
MGCSIQSIHKLTRNGEFEIDGKPLRISEESYNKFLERSGVIAEIYYQRQSVKDETV